MFINTFKGAGIRALTSSIKEDSGEDLADVDETSALLSSESGFVPPAMNAALKSLEAANAIASVLLLDTLATFSVGVDFPIPIDTRSKSATVDIDRAPSFDDERVPLARILQEFRETLNRVAKAPGRTLRHTCDKMMMQMHIYVRKLSSYNAYLDTNANKVQDHNPPLE